MYEWINKEIARRQLPDVLEGIDLTKDLDVIIGEEASEQKTELWLRRREKIIQCLQAECYGFGPRFVWKVSFEILKEDKSAFGGKARLLEIMVKLTSDFSRTSFPFQLCLPQKKDKSSQAQSGLPCFLYLSFSPLMAEGIGEEIIDEGYAIANVFYQEIAPDYPDGYTNGIGRFASRNPYDSWGKLAMWSWGASRVMDILENFEEIDVERIAIMGHSRLGKAALIAGALDQRFKLVIAIQSGAGGAALFRGKKGESIKDLVQPGSKDWFCGNFAKKYWQADQLPFDQHFLLSMIAPRFLYVSSAKDDFWSDPLSEFIDCVATSPVYENIFEVDGLVLEKDQKFSVGTTLHKGHIGYHLRQGSHFLSRDDWKLVINYRQKHGI